jgi:hypothetical protein
MATPAAPPKLLGKNLCYNCKMTETVHFFASHSWTHSHRRDGLHSVLCPWRRWIDFQDYSISRLHPLNTDTDPELARELRDIIAGMDALLIMAGMYANNSAWMQFEIDMAFAFNVPIIPVLANGQVRVPRLPTRLATFEPVRWRGDSIREALLRCVSAERRAAIEAQVAARQPQNALRGLRAPGALSSYDALADIYGLPRQPNALRGALSPPQAAPPRRNALAQYLDEPEPEPDWMKGSILPPRRWRGARQSEPRSLLMKR